SLATSDLTTYDNGVSGIDLSWSGVSGALKYQIFRAEGDCYISADSYKFLSETSSTAYSDTRVQGGKTYSYKIRVVNNCSEGSFSCVSQTYTGNCSLKPTFLGIESASQIGCGIQLSWSAGNSNCPNYSSVSYNIYRSTTPYFEPSSATLIDSGASGTNYLDTQIIPNVTYYYIVRCEDSTSSNGGPSNGGNEDLNKVVKYSTAHSLSYSYGTIFDDGGDTKSLLISDDLWKITDEINHTVNGKYCYHSGENLLDYPNGKCANIRIGEIALQPSTNPVLSFYCNYNLEYGYDGVVVEISNDGGYSFSPLTPMQSYPYSFALTGSPPGNGCGYSSSQGAFSGPSGNSSLSGWNYYSFDLSYFEGDSVIIRWNLSSDSGVTFRGFFLDDITITNASLFDNCSNSDGSMILDKIAYCSGDVITITLFDSDVSGSSTQNITIQSNTEDNPETVILYENPANSGKFLGTIQTTSIWPSSDGQLSISETDLITATYIDAYDGASNNVQKYAKAKALCPPDEIAKGLNASDIQYFSEDKVYQYWPAYSGATKYRLYRGVFEDLPNLINGNIDSCFIYEGADATAPCPENPSSLTSKLYWYLVTAVNEAGEGSAGYSAFGERIINCNICK
ncbi:MAG: immune inhibitor A, partial [Acidobacteria bacterium]|nr:immune inhibitor A [Acidobacteriota bacterium]